MLPAHLAYPDFFLNARELRAAIDRHFANPHRHRPETHQVWNYWNVPEQYNYLRTQPEKVIPRGLMDQFYVILVELTTQKLGLTRVTWPFLSLYVAGCGQGLHNDARNGRLGYVYSLTNWDQRRFAGGETLLFRERDYFESPAITQALSGHGLYELIPASFNQLLIFDNRLPHAVPRLEGTMIPQEGRIVLHGHISEGPIHATGRFDASLVEAAVEFQPAFGAFGRPRSRPLMMAPLPSLARTASIARSTCTCRPFSGSSAERASPSSCRQGSAAGAAARWHDSLRRP